MKQGLIEYRDHKLHDVDQVIDLYRRSTLSERRPVDRPEVFAGMLQHADLTLTAWLGDELVGIARTLTDYTYVAYLADLAVDAACQNQGVGKTLIAETRQRLAPSCMLVLLAAPAANSYYEKLGFQHNSRAWVLPPEEYLHK